MNCEKYLSVIEEKKAFWLVPDVLPRYGVVQLTGSRENIQREGKLLANGFHKGGFWHGYPCPRCDVHCLPKVDLFDECNVERVLRHFDGKNVDVLFLKDIGLHENRDPIEQPFKYLRQIEYALGCLVVVMVTYYDFAESNEGDRMSNLMWNCSDTVLDCNKDFVLCLRQASVPDHEDEVLWSATKTEA